MEHSRCKCLPKMIQKCDFFHNIFIDPDCFTGIAFLFIEWFLGVFFSFFRPFLMSLFCQLFWTWFCMFNIFILGLSTLVGIIVLVFSTSKLFRLFFKMMFTIIFVGLVHGLAILPVLLTGKLLLTCRTELSWSGFTVPWVF